MPQLSDFPPEVQEQMKLRGIDPSDLVEDTGPQEDRMSLGGAVGSTLKAHAGGIAGGGIGTLAGVALAPETGGLSLAIPIALGLAGSYAGQKGQQALLSDETNQQLQEQAQEAIKEHPIASIGTDVAASALASGGKFSPGTVFKALKGDSPALARIALQSGLNTAIDTGVTAASEHRLPSLQNIGADIAGGALFSEPSSLGKAFHRIGEEPLPDQTVVRPPLNGPLNVPPEPSQPSTPRPGEMSPSGTSDTGLQPKSADTVTQNKMTDTAVSLNPIDKKALLTPTEQSLIMDMNNRTVGEGTSDVGRSGLSKEEEQALLNTEMDKLDTTNPLNRAPEKFVSKEWSPQAVKEYDDAQLAFKALNTPEKIGTQEWADAFQKAEDIRNKYGGGMPPAQRPKGGLSSEEEAINKATQEKQNAIQEQGPSSVLQHPQEGTGVEGSERGGMESGNQEAGKETPKEGQESVKEPVKGGELPESPVTTLASPDLSVHPYRAGTWAVVDKVHDLPHPGAAPLADATKQTLNERDRLIGQWKNPIVESGSELTAKDKAGLQKVMDTELSKQAEQPQMVAGLSKKAQQFYALAKQKLGLNADYRIQSGEPVYQGNLPRALQKVPWYWPGMPNQQVEQTYRTNTDQAAIQKLDQTFDKWNQQSLGMTPLDSAKTIADFKTAVRGNRDSSEISHQDYFNASRRAMGIPLPPEFREPDIVKNLSRYFDRQAIDNSHYRFLEKNPKAMAALGETKDAWGKPIPVKYAEGSLTGNPQVKALLKQFRPDIESKAEQTEGSVSGLFTSSLISGPTLESHKVLSNQIGAISQTDNPYQVVRALTHALTNINQGWQHAKEGGLVKLSAHSSLDMFNGQLAAAQRWNGLSKAIRDISTLGGITTKLNAGMLQSFMESLVPSKIIRANNGDVTAQRWVRRLDPTYRPGKIYQTPEVQQLATLAAQYTHGTGDIRSLPAVMMQDSELSGFLSLAHWSVSQTTNFQHNVWEPATRGNYTPLLTGVFGATVGGYLIRELREEMSGKKTGIPSLSEIASSSRGLQGNAGPLMYNAISAMQYAGFGGLISQVAKYPFDFVYKNQPQGATFPLDQITTDMVGTVRNVASAIANDPNLNWVDLVKAVTGHVLSTDMQLSRIALNQGINVGLVQGTIAEKKLLADKMGALRRFDMVEGLPYNDIDSSSNPFMNIEQQKFKHDPDVGEAVGMLPQMMNSIIQRYGDNPDIMMQKLKGLKENVYQTFPSMETTPMQFFKYLNYLGRLEGPERAQELLQDYMTRRIQNQVKSSVVP